MNIVLCSPLHDYVAQFVASKAKVSLWRTFGDTFLDMARVVVGRKHKYRITVTNSSNRHVRIRASDHELPGIAVVYSGASLAPVRVLVTALSDLIAYGCIAYADNPCWIRDLLLSLSIVSSRRCVSMFPLRACLLRRVCRLISMLRARPCGRVKPPDSLTYTRRTSNARGLTTTAQVNSKTVWRLHSQRCLASAACDSVNTVSQPCPVS